MKPLKITTVQTGLVWENAAANRKQFDKILDGIRKGSTDIIILPEMFNTGFTMNAKAVFEKMDGPTVQWIREKAKALKAAICGSLIIKENGKFYNRLIWATPDGTMTWYDKRHLFRMAGEDKVFAAGKAQVIVPFKGWRISLMVCYDLRFPVWCSNADAFDLQIFVANWPAKRKFAWKQLLISRAIENQCFVAGVNRIGKDGIGISYAGDSAVLDPLGADVYRAKGSGRQLQTIALDPAGLQKLRKAFPVMLDRDQFTLKK